MIEVTIPYKLVSFQSRNEHWGKRSSRVKEEHRIVKYFLSSKLVPLPAKITLHRGGKKELDSDNLIASFKAIRDAVASCYFPEKRIGHGDNTPLIQWSYSQSTGKEYFIKIKMEPLQNCHLPCN